MKVLSLRLGFLCLAVALAAVPASALNVVNTSFPAVNCVFSPTCVMPVSDMSSPIMGSGFVQSRIVQGQAGSPAAGKWLYMYRIDLRQVAGITNIPYVSGFWVPFGGTPWAWDYNFNGIYTDHVFNGTSGGIGSEAVNVATLSWFGWIFLDFAGTVDAGSFPGGGESSYFIGMTSNYPPKVGSLIIVTDSGNVTLNGYVPDVP